MYTCLSHVTSGPTTQTFQPVCEWELWGYTTGTWCLGSISYSWWRIQSVIKSGAAWWLSGQHRSKKEIDSDPFCEMVYVFWIWLNDKSGIDGGVGENTWDIQSTPGNIFSSVCLQEHDGYPTIYDIHTAKWLWFFQSAWRIFMISTLMCHGLMIHLTIKLSAARLNP